MDQIVVTGMVLSSIPTGEYDRRIELLTKEKGKISAFAKGARKPRSRFVGAVNPFTFGTFTLYVGRSSYIVRSVDVINYFAGLRGDVTGAYYGFYFLEFAAYCTRENNDESEVLKLLYQTLRALLNRNIPDRLIRYIFELKLYCILGEGPEVFECVVCKARQKDALFSVSKGGLVCDKCACGVSDTAVLNQSTLYTMQYIENAKIERLYTFNVSKPVLKQLSGILDRYRQAYVDKQFHSLKVLDSMSLDGLNCG